MKKLTKKQKAKRKAEYKQIRKYWETTDKSVDYKTFKKIVQGYVKGGKYKTVKEAAEKYAHSQRFVTPEQVGKENLLSGLKQEFRATYDELRKKMGKFAKGEHMIDRLSWDDNKKMWKFTSSSGQEYWVDITNSPKDAFII